MPNVNMAGIPKHHFTRPRTRDKGRASPKGPWLGQMLQTDEKILIGAELRRGGKELIPNRS